MTETGLAIFVLVAFVLPVPLLAWLDAVVLLFLHLANSPWLSAL